MLECHEPITGTPSQTPLDDMSLPKPFPSPLAGQRQLGVCASGTCRVSASAVHKKHRSRQTMVTFSNFRYPFWPKLFGVSASRTITMFSILEGGFRHYLERNFPRTIPDTVLAVFIISRLWRVRSRSAIHSNSLRFGG